MRVGYWLGDASPEFGGIFQYSVRLLQATLPAATAAGVEILVLGTTTVLAEVHVRLAAELPRNGIAFRSIEDLTLLDTRMRTLTERVVAAIGRKLGLVAPEVPHDLQVQQWYQRLELDLIHVPSQVPWHTEISTPLVVTMHDVQELHFPEFFTPEQRAWRADRYHRALSAASRVVVSYPHVKEDIHRFFGLDQEKVIVVPPPISMSKLSRPGKGELQSIGQKFAEFTDFIFYPAQTWPHKNHLLLIDAFEKLAEKSNAPEHLIFTGHLDSEHTNALMTRIALSEMRNQIRFLGMVSDSELYWLYTNCSLVVIPTLYEAGSFPLIEAMALGIPVICSAVTSLPDTIGDRRFVFDPRDSRKLAELILSMRDNDDLRSENIANGLLRSKILAEVDTGHALVAVWETMVGEQRPAKP